MKFAVEIELGNDAMRSRADVFDAFRRSILRDESGPIALYGPLMANEEGSIRDENGNTVGGWKVETEPQEKINFRSAEFLDKVESAWFQIMQGELRVGIDPDSDMGMTELVATLAEKSRENVEMVATAQYDGEMNEIPEGEMTADEYARRVAAALAVLFYGGS